MKENRWLFAYNFNKNELQIPMTIYSHKNKKTRRKVHNLSKPIVYRLFKNLLLSVQCSNIFYLAVV